MVNKNREGSLQIVVLDKYGELVSTPEVVLQKNSVKRLQTISIEIIKRIIIKAYNIF